MFDDCSTGLSNTIEVSIWCRDTEKEIGSRLSFTPEEPGVLSGGSRFKSLKEPLVLPCGFHGTIVAWGYGPEQLCGEKGNGNQPYPVQDGDGALRFTGTSRSGSEPSQYPTQQEAGGCFKYLAGTFKFSPVLESVGSSTSLEDVEKYHETANSIMECARQIVTVYDSEETAAREMTDDTLSMQPGLWSEACHLLRAAAKLVYASSKDRHNLMLGIFGQPRSLPTMLITDGLLGNVGSVAEALSLLGSSEPALANLQNVDASLMVLSQLFGILGCNAPAGSQGTPRTSRTVNCRTFGIITALAKMQAGILVHYIDSPTVESQALLDKYTSLLASAALQQVESAMQTPDPLAAIENGILAGLAPSWVASLGSMQWNILSETTTTLLAELYGGIGRLVQGTSLKAWSPQQEEIPWVIDLQLSLGHYAITRLLRLGIEDISGTPRDQAPPYAQRLLQYGRASEAEMREDEGWAFLTGLTGTSEFVKAVATQAGMSVPDSDGEEGTTVLAIFKALLHHGGLGRIAVQYSAAMLMVDVEELPPSFIAAFEKAHENVELEREVSNELDLSRSNSVKEMASQRMRADFLMQFSAGGEIGLTAEVPDSPTNAAFSPMNSPRAADAGEVLQRQFSGRSRRKSAKAGIIAKVATQLAAAARGDTSPDIHAVFTDVREFVTAEIDLDAVSGEISHVEKLARLRVKSLQHVLRFLKASGASGDGICLASILLRRRVAALMFRGEQSAYTHFLVPFAGCGPQIASELTGWYFKIVAICLDTPDKTNVCWFAGLLACSWKPEDYSHLEQLGLWEILDGINVSTSELKGEVDLLRNGLQLATVLSLSGADTQASVPLLQSVFDGIIRAIEVSSRDAVPALPCLAFMFPRISQTLNPFSHHVLTIEANIITLLKVCFGSLVKCEDGCSDTAGTVLLLIRRALSLATPAQADAALAQVENGAGPGVGVLTYLAQVSRDGVRPQVSDWANDDAVPSKVSALDLPDSAYSTYSDGFGSSITPARLNGSDYWSVNPKAGKVWCMQVDLGPDSILITSISTQGAPDREAWTKAFTLSYSVDGDTFEPYSEMGVVKTFPANTDSQTVVTLKLMEPFLAKTTRIHTTEYEAEPVLRVELFGVEHPEQSDQNCRVLATSMLVDLPKVSKAWKVACSAFVSECLDSWHSGGDCRVALQLCGGYAETIRSGALVTLHGSTKRVLQVEKDTVFLLDPTYSSVSEEPSAAELQPFCEFDLDPALLDQLISLCASNLARLTDDGVGADNITTDWRDAEETMLAVRVIGEYAAAMKHEAAVKIAQQGLFRPLLELSVKGKPSAGLDPEIASLEEKVAVLQPLLFQATDAVQQILSGTSRDIRADMALIAKFTLGPTSSRAFMCAEITKAGGARVVIECLQDCLEKLRVGDTVIDSPLNTAPKAAAVSSPQKCKPSVSKIWHPEELRWGNCDTCQICIVDQGEPTIGSRDEYATIALEQGGRIPSCQYPGAGNAYSHGSNERALYDVAHKVATETLYTSFPDCNADSILVMHGNLDDGWGHNNEAGAMHAWKHPDQQFDEADTYAWCRGGAAAEKRFHVFVCAECSAPPCTTVLSNPTDGENKQGAELRGLSLMISGVATLQNIALYTNDETAVKVAACGGVKVLADLLSFYEEEQVVLPRPSPGALGPSAAVPRMVQIRAAGDASPVEFVKSDEVFLAENVPICDPGTRVVATKPKDSPNKWWGAVVSGVVESIVDNGCTLIFDDGFEAKVLLSQIRVATRDEAIPPPAGTSVLVLRRTYEHNGNGPFNEYVSATVEAIISAAQINASLLEPEPEPEMALEPGPEPEPEPEPDAGAVGPEEAEAVGAGASSEELLKLVSMGFSRAASIRALAEAKNNPTVAASLLADIGDAILSQPLPEGAYHIPSTFAALMIKPAIILRLVETLHAFSLRVDKTLFGDRAVGVLTQLLRVTTEQADDLLSPLPQLGDPLGMSTKVIGDGQVKASSTWSYGVGKDSDGHAAKFGRLHSVAGAGAWVAGVNDRDQWLEVDLGTLHWVTSVATQGRALASTRHANKSEWVTAYSVAVSVNGHDWQPVDDFAGNTESETVITNQFTVPVEARYVRFLPSAWSGHISMRAEVYGRDPQQVQALLQRIKTYTAFTLANVTTRTEDPCDDDYLSLLVSSGGIVEDCGRIIADVLNAPEDEEGEDELELEEPAFVLPEFLPEFQELHSPSDTGRFTNVGNAVELEGSSNYCISVLNIPFPKTGRHTAVIRMHRAPENCGVGVIKSFSAVCEHGRGSKAWIGNGANGWCLFKDGDSAHGGTWKGGNYSQYSVRDGGLIGVTFDADHRTISFTSNGNEKRDVYSGLPEQVHLAVSLYKRGKFELESVDWEHPAEDGEGGTVRDAHSTGDIAHMWSQKPNGSDSVMWLWVYIPDSENGGVTFKYRDGPGSWSEWSSQPTNMHNGWWHTAGWNRGYDRYEHSCWFGGQAVVDKIHAPSICDLEVPESSCFPIPETTKRGASVDTEDDILETISVDRFAGPAVFTLGNLSRSSVFRQQIISSGVVPSLIRLCNSKTAALPGLATAALAKKTLERLEADGASRALILKAREEVDAKVVFGGEAMTPRPSPGADLEPESAGKMAAAGNMVYPRAWMSELRPVHKSVGYGELGVGSELGYENKKIIVNSGACYHGLSMHPPSNGKAYASFELAEDLANSTLFCKVALNDDTENSNSPLTFKVVANGEVIWTSETVQAKKVLKSCELELTGVQVLQFEVHCEGDNGAAHAVWIDPQITGKTLRHWSTTEFNICNDTDEERGHWKKIALDGGVETEAVSPDHSKKLPERVDVIDTAKAVRPHRVHSELCLSSTNLMQLYALRAVLSIVQYVSAAEGFMEASNDVDMFVELFEKATLVKFGDSKVNGMIQNFVRVLAQQGDIRHLLSKQLTKLCNTQPSGSQDASEQVSIDVATRCLKSVVSNTSALTTKGSEALLSESGFVQLISAVCGTTGQLRRKIIDVFNAVCYEGSKFLPDKSLDPSLGTCLRKLYWAEHTASDAKRGGFGTRTLNTFANMMIAWSSIPACKITRPDWTYQQRQLLEALTALQTECDTDFDMSPVLLIDGNYKDKTILSLQSFLNKQLCAQTGSDYVAETLKVDGLLGPYTKSNFQAFLNAKLPRTHRLKVGSAWGGADDKALTIFLNGVWDYASFREEKLKEDGSTQTQPSQIIKALQTYLNHAHRDAQKWTHVFRQRSEHAGGRWVSQTDDLRDINADDPNAVVFSTLAATDWNRFRDCNGALTMRMSFPGSELMPLTWKQESAPTSTAVDGYYGLDTRDYSHFNGLARCAGDQGLLSAPGRINASQGQDFMYTVGATKPWTPPPRASMTVENEAAWDCEGEGVMSCEDNVLEVKDGTGYGVFVCKVPFPETGTNLVEIKIEKRQENMGIGICTSMEDLKRHSRQNKAWIGNGGHGWCLFNDGDCAHDGSWKGGSYSDYSYGTGDKIQVLFDAERRSIGWVVNGSKREHVYTSLGQTAFFCISFYKRGKAQVLTSSFPMARAPEPEPQEDLCTHAIEQEMLIYYSNICAEDGAVETLEPALASFYVYDAPPGIRGPCVKGRDMLVHEVALDILEPENPQARFETAMASVCSTFATHTATPVRTFEGSEFLRQFGPWQSAASCIEACGFHAVSEREPEPEPIADPVMLQLEPEPEPEPEPEILSDPPLLSDTEEDTAVKPAKDPDGLDSLVAMGFDDKGQCIKALQFADGNLETAIQVLLSGDIPASEPVPEPVAEGLPCRGLPPPIAAVAPPASPPPPPSLPRLRPQPSYIDSNGHRQIGVQFIDTDGDGVSFKINRSDPDRVLGLLDYVVGDTVQVPSVSTLDLQEDGTINIAKAWITTPQEEECEHVHRTLREMWDVAQVNRELEDTLLWVRCTSAPVDDSSHAEREPGSTGEGEDDFVVVAENAQSEDGEATLSGSCEPVLGPGYQGALEIASDSLIALAPSADVGDDWSIMAWQRFPLRRTGPDDRHVLTDGDGQYHVLFQGTQLGVWDGITFHPCKAEDSDASENSDAAHWCATSLSDGWHHIVARGVGGKTCFLVDGKAVGECGAQVTAPIAFLGNVRNSIDVAPASWEQLADFRCVKRAVTHAEIQQVLGGAAFLSSSATDQKEGASTAGVGLAAGVSIPVIIRRYQYTAEDQSATSPLVASLQNVLDEVRANPKILQTYQQGKSHEVEEGALAMLLLAMDAARYISSDHDLPTALRLEPHALEEKAPVPLFPAFEAGRVRTAGPGTITVSDGVFVLENGHSSSYSMCVCDVPFPDTGVHTVKVKVHAMGDCAGIGVVKSFEDAKEHRNGSKAWIGNGSSGWCLFNDGDCCHNGSWNSGSLRFNSGREVAIRIDSDNDTFTPIVDGVPRETAYMNLPKGLYFAVAMRPSGRIEIDASGCGSSTRGPSSNDWAEMIHRQYANGTPSEEQVPPGWRVMSMGSWTHRDDAELVMLMNHVAKSQPGGTGTLDESVLQDMTRDGGLKNFARIEGRPSAMILRRAQVMERLSQAVAAVLPMVDLIGTSEEGSGAIRKLRTLLLASHKDPLLKAALAAVKHTEITMPTITIDRMKAQLDDPDPTGMKSVFGQLYTALGPKARSSEIFRGAERWWKVSFKHEHITDAGGGFRETVSNIADDLNSERTPHCIRTPNQENDEGDVRDAWMPNPSCTDWQMYHFLGRLMAGAIQSAESLVVRWPPFVWKKIARYPVSH